MIHPGLLFEEWAQHIDDATSGRVHDLLVTDDYADNGKFLATMSEVLQDTRTIYIERSKYMLNAIYLASGSENGAPQVPWLLYPNETSFSLEKLFDVDDDGDVDNEDVLQIELTWQDIARVAVFAHRRGVREFIFWGNTGADSDPANSQVPDMSATTLGLIKITRAIDLVDARSTDMTSTVSGNEGIPDGVVGYEDYTYFDNAYNSGDIEADYSGPNGYPDGIVNSTDETDFYTDWLAQFGT
jgi:hypothetical protein